MRIGLRIHPRLTSCVACALSLVLQVGLVSAQTPPSKTPSSTARERKLLDAIVVEPGASCLERERLVAHVKMWLGKDHVAPDLRVRVTGDAHDARALAFEIRRGKSTRHRAFSPSPESCDDAHAVVGLSIALAIDAEVLEQMLPPAEPAPPRLLLVALQIAAAYDVLPAGSLGAQLGVELGLLPWLSLRADGFSHYSWDDTIVGSRGRFDAVLAGGSLQVCAGGMADPSLRIALCSGAAAGALHAWGTTYTPSTAETGFWLSARNGVRIDAHFGVHWLLDFDIVSAIESPAFEARRGSTDLTRQPSSTGFVVSLGPALAF